MTPTPELQRRICQYLLGQLSENEREDIERQLLTEEGVFEELSIIEDELIDKYLTGKLVDADRDAFEGSFLNTPERYEKLRFARALGRYVTVTNSQRSTEHLPPPSRSRQKFVWRIAAAIGVAIIAFAAYWFVQHQPRRPQTVATITLHLSNNTRGEGPENQRVTLPLNADAVRIVLELPERTPQVIGYHVEFEKVGEGKKSLAPIAQDAKTVTFVLPSTDIHSGQYALKLVAINADGSEEHVPGGYYFFVLGS